MAIVVDRNPTGYLYNGRLKHNFHVTAFLSILTQFINNTVCKLKN